MLPTIFVTRQIPGDGMQILENIGNVEVHKGRKPVSPEGLLEGIKSVDALCCMLTDRVSKEVIEAAPRLRIVANMAVGVDNIDISACTERGIVVTNTPGVLTNATADLTWALLMAVSRRIVEGDHYVRSGKFTGWNPSLLLGGDFYGKNLGIVGMGRIGQAVARRGRGFGMNTIYCSRNRLPEEVENELGATHLSLEEVVCQADYLTLHLPYYSQVHHLIDRDKLRMMKPTAYLINTARGAHVDEKALLEHLQAGAIAGAALDVYENEPHLTAGLADLDNVVLAPHMGSASTSTRHRMAQMIAKDIEAVLNDERPTYVVNSDVYG